ncbi:hypothetical protein JOF53_006459 [Crossiella equi]|uniref:Uncharacterized protein n=1 Tax=Crossiella equi TaxID=130796 RepID=A0ABS5AMX0_9PSEU|nr:hypothetical protein [Crossiella equi]MBP2477587.1 hypothetical protein [Crossiella equi]
MTALSGHLAGLLDQLSHPENAPTAGEPSVAEMLIVRTMTAHPAEPEELTLWRRSGADPLAWVLARRALHRRAWLHTLTGRAGARLLAPTAEGRRACAPAAGPTRLERLIGVHGRFAELLCDLERHLEDAERWLLTPERADAAVVLHGQGLAARAVHPDRACPDWARLIDTVADAGAARLLLFAWPEHREELADAHADAEQVLAGSPHRLTLVLNTAVGPPTAG